MSLKSFEITFFFYFDKQTPVFISMYVSIIRFHALNFNASFTIDIPGILQSFELEYERLAPIYIDVFSICVFHEKEALLSKTD